MSCPVLSTSAVREELVCAIGRNEPAALGTLRPRTRLRVEAVPRPCLYREHPRPRARRRVAAVAELREFLTSLGLLPVQPSARSLPSMYEDARRCACALSLRIQVRELTTILIQSVRRVASAIARLPFAEFDGTVSSPWSRASRFSQVRNARRTEKSCGPVPDVRRNRPLPASNSRNSPRSYSWSATRLEREARATAC